MPPIDLSSLTSYINQAARSTGGFEPQRKNNWVVILNPPTGVTMSSQVILTLKDVALPGEQNERKEIKWFNETRFYAGAVTPFENMTIQYHDYLDFNTWEELSTWRRRVWRPSDGSVGLAKNYKGSGTLVLLPPDFKTLSGTTGQVTGIDNITNLEGRTWELVGVWPRTLLPDGNLDMDSDDNLLVKVEFVVDRAFLRSTSNLTV